jgi:penicillin-insensitive murein endopeptidase
LKSVLVLVLLMACLSRAEAGEVIGSAAAGCLRDAEPLPQSETYQALRPHRQRHWGHPATVQFVRDLSAAAFAEGAGKLLIADMAQARGGPMPSGHASHQNGLDVDIWFRLAPQSLSREDLDAPRPTPMVQGKRLSEAWTPRHARIVELAARAPQVDRIFINPTIKQELCRRATGGDRDWLGKLRPWWGHDEHFHVRLACPADSPLCEPQKPFPEGDGCGAELESWLVKPTSPAPPERPHLQSRPLPDSCRDVLAVK